MSRGHAAFSEDTGLGQVAFGPFLFDPTRHRLFRAGREIRAGEKALAVLAELLRRPGEVVTKEELLERVWPEEAVYEWVLTQAVHQLREALGDDPRHPQYIRTVHKVGYRFVGELRPAEGPLPPHRSRALLRVGTLVLLAAGAVAFWRVFSRNGQVGPWGTIREYCRRPTGAFKPAVSRDGRFVAVVTATPSGRHSLLVMTRGSGEGIVVSGELDVRGPSPVFTPDGRSVVFCAVRRVGAHAELPDLWQVPVLGGTPRLVAPLAWAADFSPSGESMVLSVVRGRTTSLVLREAGGKEKLLVERGFWPRWAPSGRWIAYTTSNPEGGPGAVWFVDPVAGKRWRATPEYAQVYGLAWTYRPEGVVYGARATDQEPFQLYWVGPAGGAPRPLTLGAGDYVAPAPSPDGSILFVAGKQRQALFVAPSVTSHFAATAEGSFIVDAAFERESGRVVFLRQGMETQELCRVANPGDREACVPCPGAFRLIRAERETVLLARKREDTVVVERFSWGTGHGEDLGVLPAGSAEPEVSQDGSVIAWLSWEQGLHRVSVRTRSGRMPTFQLGDVSSLALSPGGRFLAWAGRLRPEGQGGQGLWLEEVGAGPARQVAAGGVLPAWVGDELLYFLQLKDVLAIWELQTSTGKLRFVRTVDLPYWPVRLSVAREGGPFAVVAMTDAPAVYELQGWAQGEP